MGIKPTSGAPETAVAPSVAPKPVVLNAPIKTGKMVYNKTWGSQPDGSKKSNGKTYSLQSIPKLVVEATHPDGSPKTIHYTQGVPYMAGDDLYFFWPSYDLLPGCIPAVLQANFSASVTIDPAAQNIRGIVGQWINDVDEWSYSVNNYTQAGYGAWGQNVRVGVAAETVLVPGPNSFTLTGKIEPYGCISLCCYRQPNLATPIDIYYDLPAPGVRDR